MENNYDNTNRPRWEGWVWKQPSNSFGRYQCRWFEWVDSTLYYYKYRDHHERFPVTAVVGPTVSAAGRSTNTKGSDSLARESSAPDKEEEEDDDDAEEEEEEDLSFYTQPLGQLPLSTIVSFDLLGPSTHPPRTRSSSEDDAIPLLPLRNYQYGYYEYGIRLYLRAIDDSNVPDTSPSSSAPYLYRSNRTLILFPCNNYATEYLIQSLWLYGIPLYKPGNSNSQSLISVPLPPSSEADLSAPSTSSSSVSTTTTGTCTTPKMNDSLFLHLPWLSIILHYIPRYTPIGSHESKSSALISDIPECLTTENIIDEILTTLRRYISGSSTSSASSTITLSSRLSIIFTGNLYNPSFLSKLFLQLDTYRYGFVPLLSAFHTTPMKDTAVVYQHYTVNEAPNHNHPAHVLSFTSTLRNDSTTPSVTVLPPLMITKRNTSLPETLLGFDPRSPRFEADSTASANDTNNSKDHVLTESASLPLASSGTVPVIVDTDAVSSHDSRIEKNTATLTPPFHVSTIPYQCSHRNCPFRGSAFSSSHIHFLLVPLDWLPTLAITIPRWRATNDCYGKAVTAYVITTKAGILHWDISHRFYEFRKFAEDLNEYLHRTHGSNTIVRSASATHGISHLPLIPAFPRGKPIPRVTKQIILLSPRRGHRHPSTKVTNVQRKSSVTKDTVPSEDENTITHSLNEAEDEGSDDESEENHQLLVSSNTTPSKLSTTKVDTVTLRSSPKANTSVASAITLPPPPVMNRSDILRERRRRKLYRWLDQVFSLSLCWTAPLVLEFLGLADNNSSPTIVSTTNVTKSESKVSRLGKLLLSPGSHTKKSVVRTDDERKTTVNPLNATRAPKHPSTTTSNPDASSIDTSLPNTLPPNLSVLPPPLLSSSSTMNTIVQPPPPVTVTSSDNPDVNHSDITIVSSGLPMIPISRINELLLPGDILLFSCKNTPSTLQRIATQCRYDHAGIVIDSAWKLRNYDDDDGNLSTGTITRKSHPSNLVLLEASGEGVKAYPLLSRLRAYGTGYTHSIVVRRLLLPGEECIELNHDNDNNKDGIELNKASTYRYVHPNLASLTRTSYYVYPCGNSCTLYRRRSTAYPPPTVAPTANTITTKTTTVPWCPCHDLYRTRLRMEKQLGLFLDKVESKAVYSLGLRKLLLFPAHLHTSKLYTYCRQKWENIPKDSKSIESSSSVFPSWPSLGIVSERSGVPLNHYYCTELIACCYMYSGLIPSTDTWLTFISKATGTDITPKLNITSALDPRSYWPNAWVATNELRKDTVNVSDTLKEKLPIITLASETNSITSFVPSSSIRYTLRTDIREDTSVLASSSSNLSSTVDYLLRLWVPALALEIQGTTDKDNTVTTTTIPLYARLDYECLIDCRYKPLQWSKVLDGITGEVLDT